MESQKIMETTWKSQLSSSLFEKKGGHCCYPSYLTPIQFHLKQTRTHEEWYIKLQKVIDALVIAKLLARGLTYPHKTAVYRLQLLITSQQVARAYDSTIHSGRRLYAAS